MNTWDVQDIIDLMNDSYRVPVDVHGEGYFCVCSLEYARRYFGLVTSWRIKRQQRRKRRRFLRALVRL